MLLKTKLDRIKPVARTRLKLIFVFVFWGYYFFAGYRYTLKLMFNEVPQKELYLTYFVAAACLLTAVIVGPVIPHLRKQLQEQKNDAFDCQKKER